MKQTASKLAQLAQENCKDLNKIQRTLEETRSTHDTYTTFLNLDEAHLRDRTLSDDTPKKTIKTVSFKLNQVIGLGNESDSDDDEECNHCPPPCSIM